MHIQVTGIGAGLADCPQRPAAVYTVWNLHYSTTGTEMPVSRRTAVAALATLPLAAAPAWAAPAAKDTTPMYGLIGKMLAKPGQRDTLIAILTKDVGAMPGCLSYVVAKDLANPDAIWISEAWDSQASHQASLSLPSVQQAIAKARPIIAGFGERFETEPVGGIGLSG
jgi:quinol monooxygenase YgiN